MILRYSSSREVLAKIYSDLHLQTEARFEDFKEWTAECIEAVGATVQFEDKFVEIEIKNYKGCLPCDMYFIDQVSRNGVGLSYATQTVKNLLPGLDKINHRDVNSRGSMTYSIQYPYIYTDVKSGKLTVYYKGLGLDEDGFPLIPDVYEYKEAVLNYIVNKLKYSELISGRISPNEYDYFKNSWYEAKDKAICRIGFYTPDQMHSMGKRFQRLVPNINAHEELFQDSTYRQNSR